LDNLEREGMKKILGGLCGFKKRREGLRIEKNKTKSTV